MSLLDLYGQQAGPTSEPLVSIPSTPGERFDATMQESFAPDRYFTIGAARMDKWQKVIDSLHTATGQAFENPEGAVSGKDYEQYGNDRAIRQARRDKVIGAYRALQQDAGVSADLPNPETIDQEIGDEARAIRGHAAQLEGTGNGWASFVGGMVAPTPENLLAFLIPPSRAVLGASTIANGFLRGLGREALYQAGTNAALTAGTSALDFLSRSETGTAPSAAEVAGDVASSAAGGAILGSVFHGLFHGPKALWEHWQGLKPEVREAAPLDVRDAMQVIERSVLYDNQNRLGLPWDLHERYQGNALDAIMNRRSVTWDELRPGDTPMTALATIMQENSGGPRVGIPSGIDLAHLSERVAALPDSEIEPFARQQKPRSFERLDRVESDLATLRQQLADEQSRTPSIHDLVDPETSLRLQAIDQDLQKPALTKRARAALEQERETITATVDPRDLLPKKAAKEQAARVIDLQAKIAKLEEQHAEAKATAAGAVQDLRTKLGRYGEDVQPKRAAADLGFKQPADMVQALQRAEFERQIRTMRQVAPEALRAPETRPQAPAVQPATPEDVSGLMKGKTASEARTALVKELEQHDAEARDVAAILKCAGSAA